ncbi:cell division protein FtsW [Candidatus Tenderia electrophaga]|jgi:cell division protein FtsW|uniref:Probable peptidoglycan glycosyltransferase FtsW n=1 Tax=Candidatus Tenderia electrophaga TaxID=1748243 RepID=A0A0S2TAX4_9GAMM|nr:cell division protein FtsW [Candidatus Tenderia electrophaga]
MSATRLTATTQAPAAPLKYDPLLLGSGVLLLALGLVMVASASLHIAAEDYGQPWFYTLRQLVFIGLGLAAGMIVFSIPVAVWEKLGPWLLLAGLALLLLVLVPGVGRSVNGATRWINLGVFNLQVSELMKLFVILYLAGYLVRRGDEVRTSFKGFLKPMIVLSLVALLLLLEPDFGAAAVIMATALAMMFIGGVRLWQFGLLLALVAAAMAVLAITSPYRMERLTTFLNPWADPFNSGFQLTQALIAIGRGEIWGVGLGAGVQKLFYLPEAHTDFLFAVLAEEFGLIGSLLVIALFVVFVMRAFIIARQAELKGQQFAAYLAYGLGVWLGLQAFINIGVNMGVLPTKGLTLPLMSYGGSSIVVCCVAVALLLRVDFEQRRSALQAERRAGRPDTRRVKRERRIGS